MGFSKSRLAPISLGPPWAGREGAVDPHRVLRPGLCSRGLGNSRLLSRSGAGGLSLGSLLFLPKRRGNYSSAPASWPSPAARRGAWGGATGQPCWLGARPPEQSRAGQVQPHPAAWPRAHLPRRQEETGLGPCWTVLDRAHGGATEPGAAVPPGPNREPGEIPAQGGKWAEQRDSQ